MRQLHFIMDLKYLTCVLTLIIQFLGSYQFANSTEIKQCIAFYTKSLKPKSSMTEPNDSPFNPLDHLQRYTKLTHYERTREDYSLWLNQTQGFWSVAVAGTAAYSGEVYHQQNLMHHGLSQANSHFTQEKIYESPFTLFVQRGLPEMSAEDRRPSLNFYEAMQTLQNRKIQFPVDSGWSLLVNKRFDYVPTSWRFNRNFFLLPVLKDMGLTELYSNYAHQGQERSLNLPRYKKQDLNGADRAMVFTVIFGPSSRPIILGNVQVKTSNGPSELHNFEMNFKPIDRPNNQKTAEIGRLFLDLLDWQKRDWLTNNWLKNKYVSDFVRYSLYQKMLSWLSWDYQPEITYAQVNSEKLEKFMSPLSPLKFSHSEKIGTDDNQEWLLTMNLDDLRKSEDQATLNVLASHVRGYREFVEKNSDPLLIKFDRNQFACLERLGIIKWDSKSEDQDGSGENYQRYLYNGTTIFLSKEELYKNSFLLIGFPKDKIEIFKQFIEKKIRDERKILTDSSKVARGL